MGRTEDFKESDKHVLELNKGLGCTHCEGGVKPHAMHFKRVSLRAEETALPVKEFYASVWPRVGSLTPR